MFLRVVLKKELVIHLMMSVMYISDYYTQPHFNVSVPIHSGADRCVQ